MPIIIFNQKHLPQAEFSERVTRKGLIRLKVLLSVPGCQIFCYILMGRKVRGPPTCRGSFSICKMMLLVRKDFSVLLVLKLTVTDNIYYQVKIYYLLGSNVVCSGSPAPHRPYSCIPVLFMVLEVIT